MKFWNRNKEEVERPVITYYAKYLGFLGTNRLIPTEEPIYCHVYEDRIIVDFLKKKGTLITIPYNSMVDMGNLDGGKKTDWNRAAPLAIIALPLILAGAFMKRQAVITVIKYKDSNSQEQTIVIDFLVDVGSAQPLIYTKMLESKLRVTNNNTNTSSIPPQQPEESAEENKEDKNET